MLHQLCINKSSRINLGVLYFKLVTILYFTYHRIQKTSEWTVKISTVVFTYIKYKLQISLDDSSILLQTFDTVSN